MKPKTINQRIGEMLHPDLDFKWIKDKDIDLWFMNIGVITAKVIKEDDGTYTPIIKSFGSDCFFGDPLDGLEDAQMNCIEIIESILFAHDKAIKRYKKKSKRYSKYQSERFNRLVSGGMVKIGKYFADK